MTKRKWYKFHVKVILGDLLDLADMFRYDRAYIEHKPKAGQKEADLYSRETPTLARWKSFNVQVESIQRCIAPSFECWIVEREPPHTGELAWVHELPKA